MRKFLCLQPPPVPAVIPPLPPADPGNPQTTRARYAQHTTVAFCADCHSTFDPMGNTFEHYDAVGGYRELENGLTVDSTGALIDGAGSITSVTDAVELAALLSTKAEVHACFVRQVYRFVSGQNESDADACALSAWTQRFDEHDANVAELMLDLVTTLASQPRLASIPEP